MIILSRSEVAVYYAARVLDLAQRGKRWRGRCPIHCGKHDSFSVDPETGLWRCWSVCARGGDIITLEIALTSAPWLEAQEAKIRAMATVQSAELIDVIVDGGESAKSLNRPGLQRLMA